MASYTFEYKAVTAEGRIVSGVIQSAVEREAVLRLHKKNLTPIRLIRQGGEGRSFGVNAETQGLAQGQTVLGKPVTAPVQSSFTQTWLSDFAPWDKPGRKDLISFAQDLAVLLESGISLNRSLSIVAELTEKKSFQKVVQELQKQIREGNAFWEALSKQAKIFPPVFVNMVQAGESGGVLDRVLNKVADYLGRSQELKEYLISALIYPFILSLTAAGSIAILLIFVIPKFAVIFSDMGVALPLATSLMLGMGNFLHAYWWLILVSGALVFFGARTYLRTPSGQKRWDRVKLRLPIFGKLWKKTEIARFSRTLGTLLESGVPILTAMNIVQSVVLNTYLRQGLITVYTELKQGNILSRALGRNQFFPSLAVQMIAVGEETGKTGTMLDKISDIYEKEIKEAIKRFTTLFEPLVILVMGGVIGGMVISILMAIFSVNSLAM